MSVIKLFKNSSLYSLLSIFQSGISFIALPVYTYYLTPEDYGYWSLILSAINVLIILYTLCLDRAVLRYYSVYKGDEDALKRYLGTILISVAVISIVTTLIITLTHKFTIDLLLKGLEFFPFTALVLISVAISPVYKILSTLYQAMQNGSKLVIVDSIYVISLYLISIGFIINGFGLLGVIYGKLVTETIFLIFSVVQFRKYARFSFDTRMLDDSRKYSLPLLPHFISGWVLNFIDRILLNYFTNAAQVGIYDIGFKFGSILNIITNRFQDAFLPWFFDVVADNRTDKSTINDIFEIVIVAYNITAFTITLFCYEIIHLVVFSELDKGWIITPVICFTYVLQGFYYFFISPVFYRKETIRATKISVFACTINVILNLILIPIWGVGGAAVSSLISSFIISILALLISIKEIRIYYNYRAMYLVTGIFMLLSFITIPVNLYCGGYRMIIKFTLFFSVLLITYIIKKQFIHRMIFTLQANFLKRKE